METKVQSGDVVSITPKMLHAIRALTEMHIIEVQIENKLVEDDIERFEYEWVQNGRALI